MKRMTIKLEYILEVPDHVEQIEVNGDKYIFFHGRIITPDLTWIMLNKVNDDGSTGWKRLPQKLVMELFDYIKESKIDDTVEPVPMTDKP